MKRIIALVLALLPGSALAQATGSPQSLPLVVDLKKRMEIQKKLQKESFLRNLELTR